MATFGERAKEIGELYAKLITKEGYHKAWELARALEKDIWVESGGFSMFLSSKWVVKGYWARYYELLKFDGTAEEKNDLCWRIARYFGLLNSRGEDIETELDYGYLLSVAVSNLLYDTVGAEEINMELQELVKKTNSVPAILKMANACGLGTDKTGDRAGAIAIFSKVAEEYQYFMDRPEVQQHFANILNNRGLVRLNLSDEVKDWGEKRNLICSAIVDLWNAEDLYMKVVPPPLKHIDDIQNRFVMAAIRLLSIETADLVGIAQKIKTAFEAKNKDEAKRLIFELKETKVKSWDEIEVGVPAPTMTFIGSIQIGLRLAEEFLEKHKEAR
ncbi:MAG: hypothetical protein AAB451_03275 [Patescibacteria group bacterium]